jgi:hypothetical protein
MKLGFGVRSLGLGKGVPKSKRRSPWGLAPIFTLYIQDSRFGGVKPSRFGDLFLEWEQWVAGNCTSLGP